MTNLYINMDLIESIFITRFGHSSWASPSGRIILMGGGESGLTTEEIQEDTTSLESFPLQYSST